MSELTDIEIDRSLALAIGWSINEIDVATDALCGLSVYCLTKIATLYCGPQWKRFSHKDPAVIWTIAEKYNFFPQKCAPNWWHIPGRKLIGAETEEKAVALAVIKALGK